MPRVIAALALGAALTIGGSASAATFTFPGTGGALPDLIDFQSTINVTSDFTLNDVNISLLGLQHSFVTDLDIFLIHNGVSVLLFDNVGRGNAANGDFTLDDQAGQNLNNVNLAGGTFRPIAPLSAFNGMSAAGAWTLRIVDTAPADAGRFNGWSLALTGDARPMGGAVPEPATWAMMIMGFGLAGAALRRRPVLTA